MSICSSDWIVHPLNSLTIFSRTPAASCRYNEQFASFFCTFIVTGDWNEVSHVILLMLHSIYSSSCFMTRRTASLMFLLNNLWPWRSWYFFRWSRMLVKYSLPSVAMYDLLYDTSGLFLLHSNTLETLKIGTLYVTSFPSSFRSVTVYYDLCIFVKHCLSTSSE